MTNRSLNAIAEATTLEQRVLLLLGEIVRDDVSAIEHDQPLSDLEGWDSLAVLDLLSGVEKALGLPPRRTRDRLDGPITSPLVGRSAGRDFRSE